MEMHRLMRCSPPLSETTAARPNDFCALVRESCSTVSSRKKHFRKKTKVLFPAPETHGKPFFCQRTIIIGLKQASYSISGFFEFVKGF